MRFIDMSGYKGAARAYWGLVTLAGAGIFGYSAVSALQLGWLGILEIGALATAVFLAGLRPIRMPGTHAVITPSDFFVFSSAILLGAPAAAVVGAFDALVVSWKNSSRWTSRICGPASAAVSIFISSKLFAFTLGPGGKEFASPARFIGALLVFACCHFVLNSLLLSALQSLKTGSRLLPLWVKNYCWIGLPYTASAAAAGMTYLAARDHGLAFPLAAGPIVALIFWACFNYGKQAEERANANRLRIQAAEAHALQAEVHLKALQESEERFHGAFNKAAIGMAIVASDGKWLQANQALCGIAGYEEDEMLGIGYRNLVQPDDLPSLDAHLDRLLAGQDFFPPTETRFIHKLGHTIWVLLSGSGVREFDGSALRFIFQVQDITDTKRAQERLAFALRDSLTDLPNRSLFMDRLTVAIGASHRLGTRFAILFLDLDRFKLINDGLGHHIGDLLLIAIARRLERNIRTGDMLARLGGDEFTILVEALESPAEALDLAARIQKALATPFKLGDRETFVSASIGVALSDSVYHQPEEILRDADTAMYRAKSLGRAQISLFDQDMHARACRRLQLETDLRRALQREELYLVYQPIVSLETVRLIGFEALLRWKTADGQLIPPAEFIPIAEEIGSIVAIGQWVLDQSCLQMREWQALSPAGLPLMVSVNLSGKQLAQETLPRKVRETLERTGVLPDQVKLEITESVLMENIDAAMRNLEHLRALGVHLSIDDFGTGYSSLSYLRRLPIDTLKIDRSFVTQMTENEENAEIVRAVVNLANSLGMTVIAEGVETAEQLDHLRRLGCDSGQGYLFSKPLSAQDSSRLVCQVVQGQEFMPFDELFKLETAGNASLTIS